MKKIFAFVAAALMTLSMSAASYGILVNGNTYFAGTHTDDFEGFQQYLAHVQLSAGDYCQLCDADNQAVWAVDLNPASVTGFTRNGERYEVTVSGCYDFYIKLKYQADELYIGPGSDCGEGIDISGGGQGGGQGGEGGEDEDVNYYAIGWINGADHGEAAYDTFEDEYLFVDGKLTINCQMGSYIAIKDHMGNFYYSKTETTIADNSVTMDWANGWQGCQKWAIPEGVNYIIMRKASYKNQIVLERVDKATYDAYHLQGVENTVVSEKAHKMIVNGQLVIIRGEKMFDLTGREL
ncbi:MAG: hypothetical protein IKR37_03415 [Paludibacteraceae bacterium]|nr:hypothetical protein [Paludibacteraceae bacterium]